MDKKRHHYIPKAYLKPFCGETGKVLVYRKHDPSIAIPLAPDNTAFHRYYYSQPTPEGGMEHNALEDWFSKIEEKWPAIVDRLYRRQDVNDSLEVIFQFIALQRVRVPACRDVVEKIEGERIKALARRLDAEGKFPPSQMVLKIFLTTLKLQLTRICRFMPCRISWKGLVRYSVGSGLVCCTTKPRFHS